MKRLAQVKWLQNLAANIVFGNDLGEGTAEELVEYALSDEGRESWGIILPDWFDAHDRQVLTTLVGSRLF